MNAFEQEVQARIAANSQNPTLQAATQQFLLASIMAKYSYNFTALGRPIIQYPQDMVAMQELIWQVKPDLIIETGIAHGGSLIMSASMLARQSVGLSPAVLALTSSSVLSPVRTSALFIPAEIAIATSV